MIIEGVNLQRTKRAYVAYINYCAQKAIHADDAGELDWDAEIKATEDLLKAVDQNLNKEESYGG